MNFLFMLTDVVGGALDEADDCPVGNIKKKKIKIWLNRADYETEYYSFISVFNKIK